MRTLRRSDLADSANWMDTAERRARLFGWTDKQVAALWVALGEELRERGVTLQEELELS